MVTMVINWMINLNHSFIYLTLIIHNIFHFKLFIHPFKPLHSLNNLLPQSLYAAALIALIICIIDSRGKKKQQKSFFEKTFNLTLWSIAWVSGVKILGQDFSKKTLKFLFSRSLSLSGFLSLSVCCPFFDLEWSNKFSEIVFFAPSLRERKKIFIKWIKVCFLLCFSYFCHNFILRRLW